MKTIEEHQARLEEIRTRQEELNTQYAGELMPVEPADEWKSLREEKTLTEETITELEMRDAEIAVSAEKPETRESGAGFQTRRASVADDPYDLVGVRTAAFGDPQREVELLRDNAMRSLDKTTFALPAHSDGVEHTQEHIGQLVDQDETGEIARRMLTTGSPTYRRAFPKALRNMIRGNALTYGMSPDEERAMSTTTTAGGFAVPYSLDPTFIHASNYSVNPWRAICRNVTITGSNTWQGVSTVGVTAARIIEAGTAADNAPAFLQPTGTVTRVHCHVPFSYEIEGDLGGLQGELTSLFQDAKDDEEATAFTTGTGTAPNPVGIFGAQGLGTAAPPKVLTAGTAAFAVADIDVAQITLAPRWRPRATWVANLGFYQRVRRFYAAGGETLTPNAGPGNQAGFTSEPPGGGTIGYSLLGRPAYECSAINTTNVLTTGTKLGVFGDFNQFVLVDRVGMNLEVIPNLLSGGTLPLGQRAIYAWWRNTTVLAVPSAFVYIQTL